MSATCPEMSAGGLAPSVHHNSDPRPAGPGTWGMPSECLLTNVLRPALRRHRTQEVGGSSPLAPLHASYSNPRHDA